MPDKAQAVIAQVREQNLTYLEEPALRHLFDAVAHAEQTGIAGRMIEAGCALGGSTIVIAAAKAPGRPLDVYDVFGTIPPPSDRDGEDVRRRYATIAAGKSRGIGGDVYYGYRNDLRQAVEDSLARFGYPVAEHNVRLVQGLLQETMRISEPIALAHIDVDWYDPVKACLSRIEPWLVPGGRIIIDDYHHWSGCKAAVDDYFADKKDRVQFVMRSRLHILKA